MCALFCSRTFSITCFIFIACIILPVLYRAIDYASCSFALDFHLFGDCSVPILFCILYSCNIDALYYRLCSQSQLTLMLLGGGKSPSIVSTVVSLC